MRGIRGHCVARKDSELPGLLAISRPTLTRYFVSTLERASDCYLPSPGYEAYVHARGTHASHVLTH